MAVGTTRSHELLQHIKNVVGVEVVNTILHDLKGRQVDARGTCASF